MSAWLHAASGAAIALALLAPPTAAQLDCQSANQEYREAAKKVADSMRVYAKCVATSAGHDKCTAEMQALDNAHDDFEDAVESYGESCP